MSFRCYYLPNVNTSAITKARTLASPIVPWCFLLTFEFGPDVLLKAAAVYSGGFGYRSEFKKPSPVCH